MKIPSSVKILATLKVLSKVVSKQRDLVDIFLRSIKNVMEVEYEICKLECFNPISEESKYY